MIIEAKGGVGVEISNPPWSKLKAYLEEWGDEVVYKIPELKRICKQGISLDLVTISCLPGTFGLGENGVTKEMGHDQDYNIWQREKSISWVADCFPGSKVTVYVADDDWKYVFVENYDAQLVDWHVDALGRSVSGLGEVKTVSGLAQELGVNYKALQGSLLDNVFGAKEGGSRIISQVPGWVKILLEKVDKKIAKRKAQLGELANEGEVWKKLAMLQVGMVVQGLLLRLKYSASMTPAIYLGTYGGVEDFLTEVKMMMESTSGLLPARVNYSRIPGVYCPHDKTFEPPVPPKVVPGLPKRVVDEEVDVKAIITAKRMAKGTYFKDKFSAPACDDL